MDRRSPNTRRWANACGGPAQARGLSLRGLAEVLGVSPSLISQVENGRAKPSVNTLYALANELGISLDVLLFMDTKPPATAPARQPRARLRVAGRWPCRTIPCSERRRAPRIRLGLGSRVGAPDDRVDPERRLPARDLRGRRRIEPGRRVPAPYRAGVGLRPERHPAPSGSGSTSSSSARAMRSASIPRTPHRLFNAGDMPVARGVVRARSGSARVSPDR